MNAWNVMDFFEKVLNGLEKISLRAVWLSGALMIFASFMVTIDVLCRKIFNVTMAGADELTGYAFGISIMMSLSYAMLHRSNIRIDAAYQHLPGWMRAVLDVFGTALLVAFISFVAWRAWFLLADTYEYGSRSITPLSTPLAIPQTLWFAGMVFAVITGIILVLAGLIGLAKADWSFVNRRLGIPTVDEQIKDET